MSSVPHNTARVEKTSKPTGTKPCPHCGAELELGLAEHMARNRCEQYTSPAEESHHRTDTADEQYAEPPTLENHAEREHGGADLDERRALADDLADDDVHLDERRALADELADAGVWD